MAEDYGKASRESLEQATEKSEIAIFCGAIIAIVVIVIGIIKGVFG
jgi:hypothetical protein